MKKIIFTMAILSVLFSACSLEGRKNGETTTVSTAVSVDSTTVETVETDSTVVDSVQN